MAKKLKRKEIKGARQARAQVGEPARQNERLLNALLSISGCATLEEALEPLLDAALAVTKMDGGGVYWVQDDVAVLRHYRDLPEGFIREVMRMPLLPPIQAVLHQQEPVEVAETSAFMQELLHRHGIRHAFSFPLRAGGTLFGFLNVGSTRPQPPAQTDIQALWVLVNEIESLFCRLYSEKALRESEERFNAFMDNSPAIAWMRDEQGRYVYLSRTYLSRYGRRLEECRGKTAFDLWPREIAEGFRRIDQEVLRTGRSMEVMEEVPTPEGGRSYWWNVKFPFQDASGRRFVGGIGVDMTERKRMEAMLQQTNERLEEQVQARTEELNRTIDQLQGAMRELEQHAEQLQKLTLDVVQAEDRERRRLAEFLHDDLQQTLAAAKFHLSMLGSRIASDKFALETLEQSKQMLKEAIEKSRCLSHELGPPVLYHNELGAVFEWLADQMASRHGVTVQVEIHGRVDSNSEPVRSFLYRTAQELLFNAAKHAHIQEAKLRLQRVRDELWLTISDKGRGFDPTSLAETAGLGLMTIRERAKLLGGRMIIKSAPGQGSIFFVAVPDVAV
ncbi:MAG: PAS domain-containing protein [Planctomycetes bacterium]|nr:PAS domain-containing protein [Planctomycetota bacterium]